MTTLYKQLAETSRFIVFLGSHSDILFLTRSAFSHQLFHSNVVRKEINRNTLLIAIKAVFLYNTVNSTSELGENDL